MNISEQIVLTPKEQATIDRWSRSRSAPLRLVQRARIIQLAAKGVYNHEIAERLNISRPTVQLWRGRFLAFRLSGLEKDAPRPGRFPKISHKKVMAIVSQCHTTYHSCQCNALEHSHYGRSTAHQQRHCPSDLETIQSQTSSDQEVQTQQRQKVSRKTLRYCRPLPESSRQSYCLLRRRKKSDSSIGAHATVTTSATRHPSKTNSRLYEAWHNNTICCLKHTGRYRNRRLHAPAQTSGIYQISTDHQYENSSRLGYSPDCRQLWNPQTSACSKLAETAPTFSPSFYSHFQFMAEYGGMLVLRNYIKKNSPGFIFKNVKELIMAIKQYIESHNQNPKVFVWTASVESIMTKISKCKDLLDCHQFVTAYLQALY